MKRFLLFLLPLSIFCTTACNMNYVLTSTPIAPKKLTQQRLLIVTYDTEATQTFLISLKNYLMRDMQTHRIEVKNVNIRQEDQERSLADFNKLKTEFQPNYLLTVKVGTERSRNFYLLQAQKKFKFKVEKTETRLRGASLDVDIVPNTEGGKNEAIWHGQVAMKYLYQSEQVTDVKKIVKALSKTLQKDGLVE